MSTKSFSKASIKSYWKHHFKMNFFQRLTSMKMYWSRKSCFPSSKSSILYVKVCHLLIRRNHKKLWRIIVSRILGEYYPQFRGTIFLLEYKYWLYCKIENGVLFVDSQFKTSLGASYDKAFRSDSKHHVRIVLDCQKRKVCFHWWFNGHAAI